MSEAQADRAWRFYVEDMAACCDKVLAYTQGIDRAEFTSDAMRYDASLRNLELIGEAATHVPFEVRAAAADVPWRMVVAFRNRLIHGTWALTTTRCGASFAMTCQRCGPR